MSHGKAILERGQLASRYAVEAQFLPFEPTRTNGSRAPENLYLFDLIGPFTDLNGQIDPVSIIRFGFDV